MSRDPKVWAGLAGLGLLASGAAAGQRRHTRRINTDPEDVVLRDVPEGRALQVRSTDGTVLHAEVFGPDDGQTIVLAHGWTEMLGFWTYVIRDLVSRGVRVVAYDLRGHGQSEASSTGDYAIERFGEDLEAVLEASVPDGERAVVAGHSLGAMSIVSWVAGHDVERRVSGAALLNTGVGDLLAESLLVPVPAVAQLLNRAFGTRGMLGVRARVPRFSTPASHAMIRYTAFGPAASPAQIAFYERMLVACPPDVRADAGIAISEIELHHAVPRLTVPTIVIAGELDRLTPPSHSRRIAEALPQLEQLIVLPNTGHMAPLERPADVGDALAELAAVAAGTGSQVTRTV